MDNRPEFAESAALLAPFTREATPCEPTSISPAPIGPVVSLGDATVAVCSLPPDTPETPPSECNPFKRPFQPGWVSADAGAANRTPSKVAQTVFNIIKQTDFIIFPSSYSNRAAQQAGPSRRQHTRTSFNFVEVWPGDIAIFRAAHGRGMARLGQF